MLVFSLCCKGDRAPIPSNGDRAQIPSNGDRAQIPSNGDRAQIPSNDNNAQQRDCVRVSYRTRRVGLVTDR
ncbi:uncharacterized protein DS421_4g116210 [Arachis hypogaea]|nr:uncharacterized protein DS421_4g116210 [Arachis hypogaea]